MLENVISFHKLMKWKVGWAYKVQHCTKKILVPKTNVFVAESRKIEFSNSFFFRSKGLLENSSLSDCGWKDRISLIRFPNFQG